jgi:hypothetical protein
MLAVHIPEDLESRVRRAAAEDDRPVSAYVSRLLERHLRDTDRPVETSEGQDAA